MPYSSFEPFIVSRLHRALFIVQRNYYLMHFIHVYSRLSCLYTFTETIPRYLSSSSHPDSIFPGVKRLGLLLQIALPSTIYPKVHSVLSRMTFRDLERLMYRIDTLISLRSVNFYLTKLGKIICLSGKCLPRNHTAVYRLVLPV